MLVTLVLEKSFALLYTKLFEVPEGKREIKREGERERERGGGEEWGEREREEKGNGEWV